MKDSSQAISKKLRILMTEFAQRLPLRIKGMEINLNALVAKFWDEGIARQLYSELHKLSGTGTSFGFQKLSAKSRKMEEYVAWLLENDKVLDKSQVKKLCSLFRELQRSVDHFRDSWMR